MGENEKKAFENAIESVNKACREISEYREQNITLKATMEAELSDFHEKISALCPESSSAEDCLSDAEAGLKMFAKLDNRGKQKYFKFLLLSIKNQQLLISRQNQLINKLERMLNN